MDLRRLVAFLRPADGATFAAMVVLVLVGMAAIYSVALSQTPADFLSVKKQIVSLAIGGALYVFAANANYRLLRGYVLALYGVGILLLLSVLVLGSTVRGTTGWFYLGPVSFQPVEFLKPAVAVALAAYFSRRARRVFGLRELGESAAIVALPVALVLAQPDLGSAAILMGIWGVVVLFAGIPKRYVAALLLLLAGTSVFAWYSLLAPYQKARIMTFVDPASDPLGQGYNVTQAIIAVGAGGWTGRGLGFGSQSQLKFLPESQTDFIFAVVAEELGFIGVCLVLGLWLLIFWRLLSRAGKTQDGFTAYLLVGLGASLLGQTLIHAGMNLGVLPVTGLGLPLVSYGGSSLIFSLLMLGIAESVSRRSVRSGPAMLD